MGGPILTRRDPDPILGTQHAYLGGPGPYLGVRAVRTGGPVLPRGSPIQLIVSWDISSLLATWRPWSRPRGGVGCCLPRG
jgi:hypothetical protein